MNISALQLLLLLPRTGFASFRKCRSSNNADQRSEAHPQRRGRQLSPATPQLELDPLLAELLYLDHRIAEIRRGRDYTMAGGTRREAVFPTVKYMKSRLSGR